MTQPQIKDRQDAMWQWFTCGRGRQFDWFAKNPDRDCRLTTISVRRLGDLAWSGCFVGCASALTGNAEFGGPRQGWHVEPIVPRGLRSIPCIVRRPDPAQGADTSLPGVFLLDGATVPSAPPSGAPAPDVDEEGHCAAWLACAAPLQAQGLALRWKPSEIDWTPDFGGLIDPVAWRSAVPLGASMVDIAAAQDRLVREVAVE